MTTDNTQTTQQAKTTNTTKNKLLSAATNIYFAAGVAATALVATGFLAYMQYKADSATIDETLSKLFK